MHIHETGRPGMPAIVFLHGNGANGAMWNSHLQRFTDYHCLAPDFLGFGQSSGEEWLSLEDTARRGAGLIAERCPSGRAHVVGLSLGSSVAFLLMAQAPERINHAVIDGAGVLPLPGLAGLKIGLALMQPFSKTEPVVRLLASQTKIPPDEYAEFARNLRMMSPASFRRAFVQALSLQQPAGLENAACPTLFVAGEREPRQVHQSNVMLAQRLSRSQSRMAPGMGHGWFGEQPDLHYRMLRAWFEDAPLPAELQPVSAALAG